MNYLDQTTGLGRAITGDGAMILGNKLIDFPCLDWMKGTILMPMVNCNKMFKDGAKADTPYIAKWPQKVLGRVGHMIILQSVT